MQEDVQVRVLCLSECGGMKKRGLLVGRCCASYAPSLHPRPATGKFPGRGITGKEGPGLPSDVSFNGRLWARHPCEALISFFVVLTGEE